MSQRKREPIEISVHGYGFAHCKTHKEARSALLTLFSTEIKYMSASAIWAMLDGVDDLIKAVGGRVNASAKIARQRREHGLVDTVYGQKRALTAYYDSLLACENKGLLYGFGFVEFEKTEDGRRRVTKQPPGNPERMSVTDNKWI